MNVVAIVLQVLLGLVFVGAGGSKLAGAPMQVETFAHLGLPQWFRLVVGVVEILGALCVLAGLAFHTLAIAAAVVLGCVMLGALLMQLRIRDVSPQHVVPPVVLLCVVAVVVLLRWSSLRGHLL